MSFVLGTSNGQVLGHLKGLGHVIACGCWPLVLGGSRSRAVGHGVKLSNYLHTLWRSRSFREGWSWCFFLVESRMPCDGEASKAARTPRHLRQCLTNNHGLRATKISKSGCLANIIPTTRCKGKAERPRAMLPLKIITTRVPGLRHGKSMMV